MTPDLDALEAPAEDVLSNAADVRDLADPMEYTQLRDAAFDALDLAEEVPALLERLKRAEGALTVERIAKAWHQVRVTMLGLPAHDDMSVADAISERNIATALLAALDAPADVTSAES
jgi:hypothetical protein